MELRNRGVRLFDISPLCRTELDKSYQANVRKPSKMRLADCSSKEMSRNWPVK